LLFLLLSVLATGCPKKSHRTLPTIPTTGDAKARESFQEARVRFESDGEVEEATVQKFESIAEKYPDDPIAPYARLYAGMSAVRTGSYQEAIANLTNVIKGGGEAALKTRAQLFMGFALAYSGKSKDALAPLASGERALANDTEKVEWLGATAEAYAASGDAATAILYFDRYYPKGRAPEKVFALARIETLAAELSDSQTASLYDKLKDDEGAAAAILGYRAAAYFASRGDDDRASDIRETTSEAREDVGLAVSTVSGGKGRPSLVGAVLPLSGRRSRVGDAAVRGLSLAAGSFDRKSGRGAGAGEPKPFTLSVLDSHSSANSATRGLEDLARDGAIAVVGPADARSVNQVVRSAERQGIPILSLDPRAKSGQGSPAVFHVMHSAEERARALAAYAVEKGVKDFAIMGPKNGYGKAVGAAFRAEVQRRGANVTAEAWYEAEATSFDKLIKKKLRKPWKAIFIPEVANRLELIAPALMAMNFTPTPLGKKARRGRSVLLLSTAEAISAKYVRAAGRYSDGAVFAPGFYPDRDDRFIGRFVERYYAAFGRLPRSIEAYAYDAALVVRAAVEDEASSRDDVVKYLLEESVSGMTGKISFDAARRRSDGGLLFRVGTDETGAHSIRAIRD
jgi:ABC-type branched-subunit amino acid transport system substrate-binding protein